MLSVKDIVKGNRVNFLYYRKGFLYYEIVATADTYFFPVPIEDCGDASFFATDKAITFMRYIRIAIEDDTLIKQPN
jgi:hypothetical protein